MRACVCECVRACVCVCVCVCLCVAVYMRDGANPHLDHQVNESIPQGAPIIQDMTCQSNIADARVEFQLIKEDGTAGSRSEFFSISSAPNTNMVTVNSNGAFNYLQSKEHIVRIRCLVSETRPACLLSLAGAATSIIFFATNIILSRQKSCFVETKYFCHDKHNFVTTNIVLSRPKDVFCHDKHVCRDKHAFVATKVLSRQTRVCRNKSFVATKMLFVAAPASDSLLVDCIQF